MEPSEFNVRVFWGRSSPQSSQVYMQATGPIDVWMKLSGLVYGPFCRHAQTLPARSPLVDLGPGDGLLAKAVVTDPCFWTPESPNVYHVSAEVVRDDLPVARFERILGIRMFGRRGRSFWMSGKRWVPRGVDVDVIRSSVDGAAASLVADLRSASLVAVADDPDDDLCREASTHGVMILARLNEGPDLLDKLRRLSTWPAVAIVAMPTTCGEGDRLGDEFSNLVIAARGNATQLVDPPRWADALMWEVGDDQGAAGAIAALELPVLAARKRGDSRATRFDTALGARAECDSLQRTLAPFGEFAGFFAE